MTTQDIQQIRLYRQHLTDKADKLKVVQDLNGLQAQFLVNAYHALKIRCSEIITADNFGEGLVKNWTIRGTVHIFDRDDLPLFKYGKERYHNDSWKGYMCRESDSGEWALTPQRQKFWAEFIVKKVAEGICEREALKTLCTQNGMTELEMDAMFHPWGGMRELCEHGFLNYKVQEKKAFVISPSFAPMDREAAELEIVRRYCLHYAPATIKDMSYFFGWSQTKAKEMLEKLPVERMVVDGSDYFYMGEMQSDYPDVPPCILLAGFDQLMLGYQKNESIFLPKEYLRGIFNLGGIVMPAILLDGQVVGRWRKKNNKMTFEMFETVSDRDRRHILDIMEELFEDIKKVEWSENL